MIAPLFNQLPSKYPKAVFLKVDVVSRVHQPEMSLLEVANAQHQLITLEQ